MKMSLSETDVEIVEKFFKSKKFVEAIEGQVRLGRENSPDFNDFTSEVIREAYGQLGSSNFNGISHAAPWFAHRKNLIEQLLEESWLSKEDIKEKYLGKKDYTKFHKKFHHSSRTFKK